MARRMSCAATVRQVRDRTKTQTRRLRWRQAKVGDELVLVEKCQGLKRGEKQVEVARVRITAVRREFLSRVTAEDVAREGFPGRSPAYFCAIFRRVNRVPEDADPMVTVIDWEYLDDA